MRISSRSWGLGALTAALAFLLAILAVLQYRWTGDVLRAERDRMRHGLDVAADRFADDFNREVSRAFHFFRIPGGGDLSVELPERWHQWRNSAPIPDLVGDIYLFRAEPYSPPDNALRGALEPDTRVLREHLWHLDIARGAMTETNWPSELDAIRQRLGRPMPRFEEPGGGRGGAHFDPIEPSIPALLIPVPPSPADEQRPMHGPAPAAWIIVRLNAKYIATTMLPELATRYFSECDVVVRNGPGGPTIASSGATQGHARRAPDTTFSIFEIRPFAELAAASPDRGPGVPFPGGTRPPMPRVPGFGAMGMRAANAPGLWTVELWNRAGSFDEIVSRNRFRNLALSGFVLVLLVISSVLLLVSARRSERLARQQMEFIAGVTHELNTPIAAVSSAGQNLADGIVTGDEQVRRYGQTIAREGRRLSAMVGQILQFAGIQGGEQQLIRSRLEIASVVDTALADLAWMLDERSVQVEKAIDANIPLVDGDAAALSRALQNLVSNAVKYGGSPSWLRVAARFDPRRRVVLVEVTDRGLGIERSELPHVFEPFYRGRSAVASAARGSGLGLSIVRQIVEAHGGRVSVSSVASRGSTFTITLPVTGESA